MKNIIKILIGIFAFVGVIVSISFLTNIIFTNNSDGIVIRKEGEVIDSSLKNIMALQYDLPSKIYNTDNVILEIGFESNSKEKYSSYGYYSNDATNIVIHNMVNDSSKLLFVRPIQIVAIDFPNGPDNIQNYIFYRCRINDTNNDGKINFEDNDVLFFSDLNGENLTQISTDSLCLNSYILLKEYNILSLLLSSDKGTDKEDNKQKLMWYDLSEKKYLNNKNFESLLKYSNAIIQQRH